MQKNTQEVSLKAILHISLPMLLSQASETIMMFTDRLFLSLLGKNYISAAMSGGLSSFVFSSFFIGTIGFINAIVAQYYGAGQYNNCYKATSQGLWLSLLCYPVTLLTIPFVFRIFQWAGHTPSQVELEYSYFRILMYGSIFNLIKTGLGGYFIGIGKTRIVMVSNLIGMLLNIPFNYILIFGALGFPAMGIRGAALGSIGGNLATSLFLLIAYIQDLKKYKNSHILQKVWSWDKGIMKKLLKYGIPVGGEMIVTVFLFNFFLLLMHSYSEDVAAAITITFNYDMVSYVPLLGLSFAITTLTGQQMGAGSIEGARKALRLALKVTYAYALLIVLIFVIAAGLLVKVFSAGLTTSDAAVIPLAENLLRLAAIYILADATQLAFAGALRGAGDTRWVMIITIGLHLVMAAGTFLMIKIWHFPPVTVWLFFIAFVVCLGIAMFFRYQAGSWKKIKLIA